MASVAASVLWLGALLLPSRASPMWQPRPEVSLDGTWDFVCSNGTAGTLAVPQFWDAAGWRGCLSGVYTRSVAVPSAMAAAALATAGSPAAALGASTAHAYGYSHSTLERTFVYFS